MASNNGTVLISCATTLAPGLKQPCARLDYLPPRASLITDSAHHPKKTKFQVNMHVSKKECIVSNHQSIVHKLITSKNKIHEVYSDVFDCIGHFPGPLYHIQVNPRFTPKQIPFLPVPVHLKKYFQKEIDKMLQAGVLKSAHQATLGSTVLS